jgi:hypothetical protein
MTKSVIFTITLPVDSRVTIEILELLNIKGGETVLEICIGQSLLKQ